MLQDLENYLISLDERISRNEAALERLKNNSKTRVKINEAAEMLGLRPQTLYTNKSLGKIPDWIFERVEGKTLVNVERLKYWDGMGRPRPDDAGLFYKLDYSGKQKYFHISFDLNKEAKGWTTLGVFEESFCLSFLDFVESKYDKNFPSDVNLIKKDLSEFNYKNFQ